jgi:hypothetical protein
MAKNSPCDLNKWLKKKCTRLGGKKFWKKESLRQYSMVIRKLAVAWWIDLWIFDISWQQVIFPWLELSVLIKNVQN